MYSIKCVVSALLILNRHVFIVASLCGMVNANLNRIVGGTNVMGLRYPWYGVLVLANVNRPNCGSSLISSKFLLTAAHCYDMYLDNIDETFHFDLETRLAKVYYLYLANTNLCTPTWRRRKIDIERVFIHPAYLYTDQPELSADIAILKIPNAVHDLQPVCLPLNGESNRIGQVVGFGVTSFHHTQHVCVMREIFLNIYTPTECTNNDNDPDFNKIDTFCAGIGAGGVDACQGDSGGLIQIVNKQRQYFIAGIVSYGFQCALKNHPGIYTNVTYHLPWILYHIKEKADHVV